MTETSRNPRRDIPVVSAESKRRWGSDVIAETLRSIDVPYVVLNPGASFRGLHDSIVNHLGNKRPQMLLVLHEEHAVAIAHGYAKVTGRPLAAILHSNVGLMHGSMAIFNAFADRVPVLVLGATGPIDGAKRRPWIDWLHTAQDQGALVRHFVKFDAQVISATSAQEAILRANLIATTAPRGPVYVCFDAAMQEAELEPGGIATGSFSEPARFEAAAPVVPSPHSVSRAADLLSSAKRPVILAGRVSRSEEAWLQRIKLAERIGARVLTDLKVGAAFPTNHPLHAAPPAFFLSLEHIDVLKEADVVLSLDWLDLGGTLKQVWGKSSVPSKVIQVSVDQYVHNGWSMDHHSLSPIDLNILTEPDVTVSELLSALGPSSAEQLRQAPALRESARLIGDAISIEMVASALRQCLRDRDACLIRLPLGWSGECWDFAHPLDYLGYDGGGGIGSGPGMAVGAALALRGTSRVPVAIIGDGDFLMGVSALWTAAHEGVPLLIIVCNNLSFFNDELHQERVAKDRGRPIENRWIGQRIADPAPDLSMLASGQGLVGIGPIEHPDELAASVMQGITQVLEGRSVVIDVRVKPGYSPAMSSGMTRSDQDS